SGSCASFAAEAEGDGVLFMTPSASAENVIETGNNAFRVCFGDAQQGTLAADQLVATYSKIGVIYDTSDPYSAGIYEAFEAEMTKLGKAKDTDYFVYTFTKETNKDFSTQVTELKAKECEVLFLPFYYTEAALVCKKAAQLEFNVPVFGCDGLDGIKGQLDDTVTAQVSYITPFDVTSTDAKVKSFVDAFQKKYGEAPNQFAADGYDAMMILFEAMKTAGVNDVTISASDLADLIRPVLTGGSFKYDGVTGKNMTWGTDGSCNKDAQVVIVDRD
ncbi:MAG: ABC transporter substrate-binding protein, partial [Oscillospiraceae bacterium]|nr:ABC transporter substrate-binding protein [Oscillospiraceae bacterium]